MQTYFDIALDNIIPIYLDNAIILVIKHLKKVKHCMNFKQKNMGESKRAIFTIHNISSSSNLYAFVYLGQDAYYTEQRVQQGQSWSRSYGIWIFN